MTNNVQIRYWSEQIALFNDGDSFRKLFLHFNNNLYKLSFSLLGDHQAAEDVLSDTFANLWQSRSRLLEIENLTVYLYVSVKNLSLKYLMRTRRQEFTTLDDLAIENLPSSVKSPEDLVLSREMMRIIEEAINNLPPRCRLIFRLIREDGLRYKEVSQILDISIKTIDAQMAIASKRIAQSVGFHLKK